MPEIRGGHDAPRAPVARARRAPSEEVLILVALAATLSVALTARHFPYQDVSNHVARFVLIEQFWRGAAPSWVDVQPILTSYAAMDVFGAALVHLSGPRGAARGIATVSMIAIPLGMYALLRRVSPNQRGWALIGVLLSLSFYYLMSFFNYVTGVGAALLWLAAWWPRRASAPWNARLALALGVAALFALHPSAPLIALTVVGVDVVWVAWGAFRERTPGSSWRAAAEGARPRLVTAFWCGAALGAVWIASAASTASAAALLPPAAGNVVEVEFRSVANKVLAAVTPFYSFSLQQMIVIGFGYAVAFAAFARQHGRALWRHPLTVAAILLGFWYCIFPQAMGGAWRGIDSRWLLPAYLLIFCGAPATARAPRRAVLVATCAACLAHAGVIWFYARAIDLELDDYDRAIARLPPRARLLPIVSDQRRHGRVTPYRHYALWYTSSKQGRVAGMFAADGLFAGDYPISHLAHFRELRRLYYLDEHWGTNDFQPLPWPRISRDFDYIVQAGTDARARGRIVRAAPEAFRVGEITVYSVVRQPVR